MKVTDEIRQPEADGGEAARQNDIFYTMLNGKTVTEEIETSRGKFTMKFPKQRDMLLIDRRVAAMRGNIPVACFDGMATFAMQKVAFLDTVIDGGEAWYENLKAKDRNFSWEDMPDTEFVDEVYVKAWSFRNEVQERLKSHAKKADSGAADGADIPPAVGDGLFSEVASPGR